LFDNKKFFFKNEEIQKKIVEIQASINIKQQR